MSTKQTSLTILLLIFLSGTFSLQRLNTDFSIDIRFILSILLLIFIIASLNYNKIKNQNFNKSLVTLVLVFIFYLLLQFITLTYTPNPFESFDKIFDILFLMFIVIMTIIITQNMEEKDFFNTISLFFIVVGIVYVLPILFGTILGSSRESLFLSGPNVATRILFFASCSAIYLNLRTANTKYIFFILIFLGGIIIVGSRGGIVSGFIILMIYFLSNFNVKKNISIKYKSIFIAPIFLLLAFMLYQPIKQVFLDRVITTTFSGGEIYTSGRERLYTDALNLIEDRPIIGYGVDSFTQITGYVYPHNLLLEMTLEIGVLGSIIFIFLLYFALKIIIRWKGEVAFIFSLLPLYMILVQMFSGEIYDFRYYFLFAIPLMTYKNSGYHASIK